MRRQARLERRVSFKQVDGATVEVGPGSCWVDDGGPHVVITWWSDAREVSARIAPDALVRHLARRELVYLSW